MPYLTHRSQGRCSSQRLQAPAQFVHCVIKSIGWLSKNITKVRLTAILTCLRFGRDKADGVVELDGGGLNATWEMSSVTMMNKRKHTWSLVGRVGIHYARWKTNHVWGRRDAVWGSFRVAAVRRRWVRKEGRNVSPRWTWRWVWASIIGLVRIWHHSRRWWIRMVLGRGRGRLCGLRHRVLSNESKERCARILDTLLNKVLKQVAEKGLGRGLEKCSLRRKDSELRLKCPFSVFFVARLDVDCQIRLAAAVWWILGQNKRYTGHLRGYWREKNQFHRPRVNNALFGALRTVHVAPPAIVR